MSWTIYFRLNFCQSVNELMRLRQIALNTVIFKSQNLISLYLLNSVIFSLYPYSISTWWRLGESNSWPPACKAGALPTKLSPQLINQSMSLFFCIQHLTMLVSQIWWVWQDLNLWPHAYQACALTNWATDPQIHRHEEQLVVDSYQSSIFR